ncbi:MAG: insulinase family protein [Polyangiaceae bacterium]|nr:insulinase family protein [Polyangiaceae bacterium]MCW5789932.1 insulinase family protein [Polyangiaceae bacterium]
MKRRAPLEALKVSVSRLESGLTLFAAQLPWLERGVISASLRAGPHYEQRRDHGLSHFLEHMLYRGTASHPSAHQLVSVIERQGGYLDAMTYCDHGVMSLTAPSENLLGLIPVFAEVYQRPLLGADDPASIEVERGIVRQEMHEDLDEAGRQVEPENLVRRLAFGDTPLGRSITGHLGNLERFDAARLAAHHARHYTAKNSVIGVVSALSPRAALAELTAHFDELPTGELLQAPQAPPAAARRRHVSHAGSQTSVRLTFRAPSQRSRLEPATQLLLRCLDDGMSTRLYARLSDALGLCYSVSAEYEAYADGGLFELAADTQHHQLGQVVEELLSVVSELRAPGASREELSLAQQRHRWHLADLLLDPSGLAELVGLELLIAGEIAPQPLAARAAELDRVTLRQLREAARSTFQAQGMGLFTLGRMSAPNRARLEAAFQGF